MNHLKIIQSPEILLFSQPSKGNINAGSNALKEFMRYLKSVGIRGKIDFAFAGNGQGLHPELSIKENYILDSVPTSLIRNREDNFRLLAKALPNQKLKELIQMTECLERKAKTLNPSEKNLAGIAKALLAESEYIFLDSPDANLGQSALATVKEALAHESVHKQRKAFIRPANPEKWIELASHTVELNAKGIFIKTSNPFAPCSSQTEQSPAPLFELVKKAG